MFTGRGVTSNARHSLAASSPYSSLAFLSVRLYNSNIMGKILIILGRSASGKDKLYNTLLEDGSLHLQKIVLYTTRPIRAGEVDGETYHFIDEEKLHALRRSGKVIEERTYETVAGPWTYLTADEGIDPKANYILIGTLESFAALRAYYGAERVVPLFIRVTEEHLLERAMKRERKQEAPDYREMCRRFLSDADDFSEEKIEAAGITEFFQNDGGLGEFLETVRNYVAGVLAG